MCAVSQEYADGSNISIVVTDRGFASNQFLVMVINPAWSIKASDVLGEITVSTPTRKLSSAAAARENSFAVTGPLPELEAFVGAAKIGRLKLYWAAKQRELGEYDTSGLGDSLPAFERCLARRFDPTRDPFRK